MKKLSVLIFAFAAVVLFGFTSGSGQDEPAGKKIFTEKKCMNCHSVESEGITAKSKKNVDLGNVGAAHDQEFLKAFLQKKEAVDEVKHPSAFKGTDEELDQLTAWLASLKSGADTTGTEDADVKVKVETKKGVDVEVEVDSTK